MCFDAVPGHSSRLWTTRDTTVRLATSHRVAGIPAGPFTVAPAGGCDVVTVNRLAGIPAGPFNVAAEHRVGGVGRDRSAPGVPRKHLLAAGVTTSPPGLDAGLPATLATSRG